MPRQSKYTPQLQYLVSNHKIPFWVPQQKLRKTNQLQFLFWNHNKMLSAVNTQRKARKEKRNKNFVHIYSLIYNLILFYTLFVESKYIRRHFLCKAYPQNILGYYDLLESLFPIYFTYTISKQPRQLTWLCWYINEAYKLLA